MNSQNSLTSDGQFSYEHDGGESTTDVITFTVQDSRNGTLQSTVTGTINVEITPVNDSPTIPAQNISVSEGSATKSLNLSGFDAESDAISYTIQTNPINGRVDLENGTMIYTHNGSETTTDSFVIRVFETENSAAFGTQTFAVAITASNDAPTASVIEDTVLEGGSKAFTFTSGQNDQEGLTFFDPDTEVSQIVFRITQSPSNGTATVQGKTITYAHNGSETTSDSFEYEVFDGSLSTKYTATLQITPRNDNPTAVADLYFIGSAEESISIAANIGVLQNDTDAEGSSLSAALLAEPTSGTVVLESDGSFTYTVEVQGFTTDSFTYTVVDSDNGSSTGTVTIESSSIRPTPNYYSLVEGAELTVSAESGLLSDDIDSNDLSISSVVVAQPSFGTVEINEDGSFVYTHDGSDNLIDRFTYKTVNANGDESKPVFVKLVATNVNDAPVASNTSVTVTEDGEVIFTPNYEDTDTSLSNVVFAVTTNSQSSGAGTLVVNQEGSLTYTHNGSEVSTDSFNFTVSDGEFTSAAATIRVSVLGVNDKPIIDPTSATLSLNEGATLTQQVVVTDAESDTTRLVVSSGGNPSAGSITISGNTVTYTHNGEPVFTDSFILEAFDGTSYSDPQVFTVAITEVNDAPKFNSANNPRAETQEGGSVAIPLNTLFVDEEGDAISFTWTNPSNGTFALSGSTYTYTHNGSETLTDTFTVTASDGTSSSQQKFTIAIAAVNDAPVISGLENLTIDQLDELIIRPVITDPDDTTVTVTVSKITGNFSIQDNEDGTWTLFDENRGEPGDDTYNDSYSLTVTADDGDAEAVTQQVTVGVVNIDESLPQVVLRSSNAKVEEGETITVLASLVNNNFYSKQRDLPAAYASNFTFIGQYNGHKYYRYDGNLNNIGSDLNYSNAKAIARLVGGYPLVIEDALEQTYVIGQANTPDSAWLGYVHDGSVFNWENNSTSKYTNWVGGNLPNDPSTNNVAQINKSGGTWSNQPDTTGDQLIVEFDQLALVNTDIDFNIELSGTAAQSDDYGSVTTSIRIPANSTSEISIPIETLDDSADEATETIIVSAVSQSGENLPYYIRKSQSTLTFEINDNDAAPVTFSVNGQVGTAFEVGEEDGEIVIEMNVANAKTFETSVLFNIAGTATSGEDYEIKNLGYVDNFQSNLNAARGFAQSGDNIYFIGQDRQIWIYDTTDETTSKLNTDTDWSDWTTLSRSYDNASFKYLKDITSDSNGNLYLIDENYIRKINTTTERLEFVAGDGQWNNSVVDGIAEAVKFGDPRQIASNTDGSTLYVLDRQRIREITFNGDGDAVVSFGAGSGNWGDQDGSGNSVSFGNVQDMEVDADGNLIIADDGRLRKYVNGTVTTLKRVNEQIAGIDFASNGDLASNGDIYFSTRWSNQLYRYELATDRLVKLIDSRNNPGSVNGPINEAKVSNPGDVLYTSSGELLFAEEGLGKIRKIDFVNKIRVKAGEESGTYVIDLKDDNLFEADETLLITAVSPSGIDLTGVDPIAFTLVSDDAQPEVQITASSTRISEAAENVTFTVQLGNAGEASAKSDLDASAADQYTFLGDFAGSKYYLSNFNRNWEQAKLEAEQLGGTLVVINNAEENEFIRANKPNNNSLWIGLSDTAQEGNFVWANGSTSSYVNWNNGEPNNAGDEDFVEFLSNGLWNDLPQRVNLPYVIEFSGVKSSIATEVTLSIDGSIEGSATAGEDYTAPASLVVTIPAGENKQSISFTVTDDETSETAEFIKVIVASAEGGTPSSEAGSVTVEIVDNELASVTLLSSSAELLENGDPITITATSALAKQTETALVLKVNQGGTDTAEENKDFFIPELDQIATIAGSGQRGYNEGKGQAVRFSNNSKMIRFGDLGFLIADRDNNVIRLLNDAGEVSTYIGNGNYRHNNNEDGKSRTEVALNNPADIAVSPSGELFILEQNSISKIDSNDNYKLVANQSNNWGSDDNDNALQATFRNPSGMAFDSQGNLFVVDGEHRIRKIVFTGNTASVSTYAGNGQWGNQNGALAEATFSGPQDIIIDENDVIYIAEHNRIRKITPQGIVSNLAGEWWGDNDGSFQTARFRNPSALAFDASGNILVTDDDQSSLRILYMSGDKQGQVETLIGKKGAGYADGAFADAKLNRPRGVVATASKILVSDTENNRIRQITLEPTIIIPAGETSGSITLIPLNDYKYEVNESISLTVSSSTNVDTDASTLSALGITMISEESAPSARLMTSSAVLNEDGGAVELSVRLSDQFSTTKPDMDVSQKGNFHYLGEFNGSYYYASKQNGRVSYSEAKRIAEGLGGSLAIISSQQENDFITRKIFEKDPDWDANNNRWLQHWIGYTYVQDEVSDWKWSNGQEFEYSNWQGDNYLRNAENRPFARLHENGQWDNASKNDQQRYVVEFSGSTSDVATTVNLTITPGEGVTAEDFSSSSTETISIPAGAYKGTITITGIDDDLDEAIETLTVAISAQEGSDVTIDEANQSVVLQINDDDITTATVVASTTEAISEAGGSYDITATLANAKPYPVVVDLEFDSETSGAAIFGEDYTSPSLNKVSTLAGTGSGGFVNGATSIAQFDDDIRALATDSEGNVYVADSRRNYIRKINVATKQVTTYAGGGNQEEGTALEIYTGYIRSMAIDAADNLYFWDDQTGKIRKITPQGQVSVVIGTNQRSGNDGTGIEAGFWHVHGMAFKSDSELFIMDGTQLRLVTLNSGADASVVTLAGSFENGGSQDGFGTDARFSWSDEKAMAVDLDGNLIIADPHNNRIRKYNVATEEVTTIAGSNNWDYADGFGTNARFRNPAGITIDANGIIYVSDSDSHRIRRIEEKANGQYQVTTIAGGDNTGFENGAAIDARFARPSSLTNFGGKLYVADRQNAAIRQVQLTPTITIAAGAVSGSFTIEAINDVVYETDEQILATASVTSGAVLAEGSSSFSTTLTSDDNIPIVAIEADNTILKENGGTLAVKLTLLDEEGAEVIWEKNDLADNTKASFNYLGEFEGHKYYQSFNRVSFEQANQIAQSLGAQLLIINSQAENEFIGRTIRAGVWIAVTWSSAAGSWVPLYGESDYFNFENPNVTGDATQYAATYGNTWYNHNGNDNFRYVLEFGPTKSSGLDTVVTIGIAGSASADAQGEDVADFSLATTEVTIPAGESSASFVLTAGNDAIDEPIETIVLSVAGIATFNEQEVATISTLQNSLTVEIDDDEAPTVELALSSTNIAENKGSTTLTATLTNEKVSDTEILFNFEGQATFLEDYRTSDLGKVETLAGTLKTAGFVNGQAENAIFNEVWGMVKYTDGSYLLADIYNNVIRKLNPDGSVENFIGGGNNCCNDSGPRTSVAINRPTYLDVDATGNVYFATRNNRVYRYDAATDRVNVIAGSGQSGFSDGVGQTAQFRNPHDVEVNDDGSIVYVLDFENRTVRKLTRNQDGTYTVSSLVQGNNNGNQQVVTGSLDTAQFGRPYEMEVDWESNQIFMLLGMDWGYSAMGVIDLNSNTFSSTIITGNNGYFRYWGFDLDSDGSLYLTDTQDLSIVKMNFGQPENSRYAEVDTDWTFQSHSSDIFKFYQLAEDSSVIEAVVEYNEARGSTIWQGGINTGTSYGLQNNNSVITATANYFRQFEPGVYKIQINTTNLTYSITQTSDVPTRGYTLSKVAGTTRGYADGTADEAKFEMPSSILLDGSSAIVYDDQNELLRKVRIKPALIVEGRSTTASIDLTAHKDQFFEGEEVIELSVAQITNGTSATTAFDNITITDATFLTRVINAPFEGVQDGKVSWGDYDRDGDMDLLLMGSGTDGTITNIYRNNDGVFVNTNQNFTKFLGGDAEFVDVDQDGWLDVALSGNSPKGRVSELYINRGASSPSAPFFQLSENYVVEGLSQSDMEWGDLDNDGDPDLIISGINAANQYRTLYYTNLGNYTFLQEPLFNAQGRIQAEVDMFDSDNDGDLDVGIAGVDESDDFWFEFFTNSYYGATPNYDANYNFYNIYWLRDGKTLFQDLDVDGRMDYFAMGLDNNRATQQRSNLGVSLNPLSNPDFAFADYNNDGLSDVVITGEDAQGNPVTKLYVTLGGLEFGYRLYETDINLVALRESTVDWIDYDLDGDLDLFMTGIDESGVPVSVLYEANNVANLNEAPAKVANLTAEHSGNGLVAFEWDKPSDNANTEFRYALRVGTTPGGSDALYVNATDTGTRLIDEPALSTLNSRELILNPGTYYASVQAIDAGNRGGAFSDEIQFTVDYAWKRLNLGGIIDRSLRPTSNSQIEFVDYDGDGDMDLIGSNVGTDYTGNGSAISVFGFENGVFVPKQQIGGGNATFGLGDLNKNGFVDFVYAQEEQQGSRIYPVFNFEGVIAERIAAGETVEGMMSFGQGENFAGDNLIPSLYDAKIAIKDIDNDGTPEVILAGASSQIESEATAAVYLLRMNVNEGEELVFDNFSFSVQKLIENSAKLEGLSFLSFDLGDVDGDSDYDLLFTGFGFNGYETILFENTGNIDGELFVETNNNFIAVREGSASFVDIDGDGLLDVVFTGQSGEGDAFRVYKNTGNIQNFAALEVGLPAIRKSNIDFGDFNEDGYYDILYSGTIQGEGRTTRLAEFNPATSQFEDADFDVSGYLDASVGFGDFDGDGDLDFVLSGEDGNNDSGQIQQIADIFINVRDLATAQTSRISLAREGNNSGLGAPAISTARRKRIAENSYEVTVEWGGAKNKAGNPDSALTYELKVGTSKNGTEVLSTVANADGVRAVATTGNAESNTSWKLNLPEGTYFAQVQAVDASYQGSEFSEIFEFAVVNSFKLGDANGDDVVNVLDLTTNIEYIMTGVEPTAFVPEVADVNLDGAINVTDISGIVELILNPESETATSAISLAKAVDKSDYFSSAVVGEATLALKGGAVELRSNREVVALQFSVNKNASIRLSDRLANFTVVSFERGDRMHYLIYSLNNQNILATTDKLFTVSGNTPLEVSDLVANTAGVGTLSVEFLDESYLDQYTNGAVFYPNPARDVASLYVGLDNAVRVSVELFNMQGSPVLQYTTERNVDQINLNVSTLSSGLYAARVQITTEDGRTVTRSLKLVIQ